MYYNGVDRMEKGMRYMVTAMLAIESIIESPTKKPSKADAAKMLRSCGILDENDNLYPAFKNLLVKETKGRNGKK